MEETVYHINRKEIEDSRKEVAYCESQERELQELQQEKEYIFECASHLSVFLRQNALVLYNDAIDDYLDILIRHERDEKKIKKMKKEKRTYQKEIRAIQEIAFVNTWNKRIVAWTDIHERRDKLFSLKHMGKALKKALGTVLDLHLTQSHTFIDS